MEEMKAAPVVKLDTLSDVNDIGKPWRFEEDGAHRHASVPVVGSGVSSHGLWTEGLHRR